MVTPGQAKFAVCATWLATSDSRDFESGGYEPRASPIFFFRAW